MSISRERVWSVLKGQPCDSIPKGELLITEEIIKQFPHPSLDGVLSYLGADLVTLSIEEATTKNPWKDWVSKPYFVFGLLQGPFTLAAIKIGWSNLLRLLKNNPGEVMSIMEKMVNDTIFQSYQALDQGCEGILVADDLAGIGGLLVSPVFLQKYYFPLLEKMLRTLDHRHIPFLFHSDGQVLQLIPFLKDIGFWGIQSLQPSAGISTECFSPGTDQWVYWGNFEFENADRLKSNEEVTQEIDHLLHLWSNFPGYIFGSSGGLYQGLSTEIIKSAYQTVDLWNLANKS